MFRAALVLGIVAVFPMACAQLRAPKTPENTPVDQVYWLEQNWSDAERHWAHHASQGTATLRVPYKWFVSLEQPSLSLWGNPGSFIDPDYLSRFGFIPSPVSARAPIRSEYGYPQTNLEPYVPKRGGYAPEYSQNPDRLPVGFARLQGVDPRTGEALDRVGFTCAACHTGQLEYEGTSIRIDGAPAMTDLGKLRKALAVALAYTKVVPGRFDRFADRVLGEGASRSDKQALKKTFDEALDKGAALQKLKDDQGKNVAEGFTRLDALTRIGNEVFFEGLIPMDGDAEKVISNYETIVAPVNFPHIWHTSWFDWVQYDASIMQPMIRNAGEALGVSAPVNLTEAGPDLYKSEVAVSEIFELENLLGGENPRKAPRGFKGLQSPKWPEDILGMLDADKASRGRKLYDKYCDTCHLPPSDDDKFWGTDNWKPIMGSKQRYLHVKTYPVGTLGTDPAQARILTKREVDVPNHLEIPEAPLPQPLCSNGKDGAETRVLFAWALGVVVEKTVEKWYDDHDVPPRLREEMNGNRPNCLQAHPEYKARPLNGIWATAPFLHNGSVANLYELLSPVDERSEKFYLGSRLYDPVRVGYDTAPLSGGFELDTSLDGNLNTGHEYTDVMGAKGRLGPELTEDQRYELIEFLKSL